LSRTRGLIWHDGELQDWAAARTHVMNHTLNYGIGVIEGLRAYPADGGSALFRLHDHTRRLFDSAHILGIDVPYGFDELIAAQCRTVRASGLSAAYLRVLLYCGVDGLGLHADDANTDGVVDDWHQDAAGGLEAHCFMAAWHMGPYFGATALEQGLRVRVSSFSRHHVNVTLCRAKATGNYLNSMMALREATRDGYDEALMLDHTGFVMEGSGENVFIVRDGVLYTPDLTAALDGITRRSIITLAREDGIEVVEKPHHPRRGLHRRRGLLHRHRRRGHADPRGGRARHRQWQPRPDHRAAAGAVLRGGAWSQQKSIARHIQTIEGERMRERAEKEHERAEKERARGEGAGTRSRTARTPRERARANGKGSGASRDRATQGAVERSRLRLKFLETVKVFAVGWISVAHPPSDCP
jgi:branched-chain amino acid aminotransferase